MTVVKVLAEFDEWLARFGKRYLHLNTGGDEYVGFIVDADRLDIMIAMAKKAGIEVRLETF
ncbi:hypothetical protein G9Q86_17780 [Pseudomonas sp. CCUG 57209]|uniref:DUF6630 family protein n=1 Tax=Pseudomonas sivasensis TaxID=1880678 RepID=UPI0015EC1E3F|nr:hypothetical protein [Pseudomonas sivasensis]MBA2930423.1 hypothetical protein [Pseudomonas sivasensis]